MPFLSITHNEWDTAKKFLTNKPNGTKLPHTHLPTSFNSKHSFIKINGEIYGLAKGNSSDSVIPDGRIAKTKYAQDESGNLYVIKISKNEACDNEQQEFAILDDLSLAAGTGIRQDKNKQYTTIRYLGKNLQQILDDHSITLTNEQRLDIAIKLAYQIYSLHYGLLSKSKTAYAHQDIKPDNVTIDENGNVSLIDFGFSTYHPHQKCTARSKAPGYTAYTEARQLTGAEHDVIGLKRLLYLPWTFYCHLGYIEPKMKDRNNCSWLLSEQILTQYNLTEFIDTSAKDRGDIPEYTKQVMDISTICAALINAREELGFTHQEIKTNRLRCHAILGCYFSPHQTHIKTITADNKLYKLAAGLHVNQAMDEFDDLKHDKVLIDKICHADNSANVLCLVALKLLNLMQYDKLIIQSSSTAHIIEQLLLQNKRKFIAPILEGHSDALVDVLNAVDLKDLTYWCTTITDNPLLIKAIASLPKNEEHNTFIKMVNSQEFSDKDIILYCQSLKKRQVITTVLNNIYIYNKTAVIIDILNETLRCDDSLMRELANAEDKSRVFNLLFDANIKSEEDIDYAIRDSDCRKILVDIADRDFGSCFSLLSLVVKMKISHFELFCILKVKHAEQMAELMLADTRICKALLKYCNETTMLRTVTLYNNKIGADAILRLLQDELKHFLLICQIDQLIEAGYSAYINKDTLPQDMQSVEQLMLNIVAHHDYRALNAADEHLKESFDFMLCAAARDIRSLEYADSQLRSSVSFIMEAARINHLALQYAHPSLKDNIAFKQALKCIVLHYDYASINNSRLYAFRANLKDDEALNQKYKHKTDDALITAILKAFKHSLEGKSIDEIDALVDDFKQSKEYKLLCTRQGMTSSFFKLKTSPVIAVDKIIDDAHHIMSTYASSYLC